MMKNINRSTSFDDYGAEPSSSVWTKIEKRLPPPRGKKRSWWLWGVAALLLSGVFVTSYFFDIEIKPRHKELQQNVPATTKNKTHAEEKEIPTTETKASFPEKTVSQKTNQAEASNEEEQKNTATRKSNASNAFAGKEKESSLREKGSSIIAEKKITSPEKVDVDVAKPTPTEEERTMDGNIFTQRGTFEEKISEKIFALIPVAANVPQTLVSPAGDVSDLKKVSPVLRWELSLLAGWNYSYRNLNFVSSGSNTLSEGEKKYLSENEKGINTFSFEAGVSYSVSPHFSLVSGINYFKAGQERSEAEITFFSGSPGDSNRVYSVNTSAANLTVNGELFDNTYYNNSDSSLFTVNSPFTGAPTIQDSSTTKKFNLKQEFSFVGVPLLLQYSFTEHRVTPYVALGFSAAYLVKEETYMKNKNIATSNSESSHKILFFAEAHAGIKFRMNNSFSFKLQPSLRYGLNSLNDNNNVK
ncbi:MAG: outer membrane beta-barrel protein, partial [Bacteroidia bacterium]|nr:outer membrane beta-barrel protein [Bacteroidia bacterium]